MVGWRGRLPSDARSWLVLSVRLALILAFVFELYVTAHRQRPDLVHPTTLGSDPWNQYAAALRLNDGHNLYGPLLPGDLAVPGYPALFPAPLLSPPLVAVVWRLPAALLGPTSMTVFWLGALGLVTLLTAWFALRGRPSQLAILAIVLAAGWVITLAVGGTYRYLGFNSPLSFAALAGNVNAFILALFVLVWWALSAGHEEVAGVAGALATALKLGPLVLVWWFVVQRRWRSAGAFVVALAVFGLTGLLLAGVPANLDYAKLALGGAIQPQGYAVADMLRGLLHVGLDAFSGSTYVVIAVGVVAIFALRFRPRAAFAVAIATTIYSSPVVLAGNLALFLAAAAPWAIERVAEPGPGKGSRRLGSPRLTGHIHRRPA